MNALSKSAGNIHTQKVIEDIRFIRPEVALVSCIKYVSDNRPDDPGKLPVTKGALSYVMENNKWVISLAQTTPIMVF